MNPFSRSTHSAPSLKYITADEAKAIDKYLMGPNGAFSLDQVSAHLPKFEPRTGSLAGAERGSADGG